MPLAIFPTLQGLTWNVSRIPKGSTALQDHTSGRSSRFGYWANPMYEWDLTYDLLRDFPWLPGINSEMRRLQGFFLAMQGKRTGFLYRDPDDNQVTRQFVGTGNGTAILFPLVRTYGDVGYGGASITEPIGMLDPSVPFTVFLNGITQPAGAFGYVNTAPGNQQLGFVAAPPAGVVITASFGFLFYVHFKDDQLDFAKFANRYWAIKKITLESLRPET